MALPHTRRSRLFASAVAFVALLGVACATPTSRPRIPPVTEASTGLVTPGKFVWMDLISGNTEASERFYGGLFGWTFHQGDGYTEILKDGKPIGGIVPVADSAGSAEWVGNLSVADVDAAVAELEKRGGHVDRTPRDAPDRGRIALVTDPEGALVLFVRASGGDPPDADAEIDGWLWHELWTHDPDAATEFYSALTGYQTRSVELDRTPYRILEAQGRPRAGLVKAPPEVNPAWLPYVRVENVKDTAARAAELGARIVLQDEYSLIMVDPEGAPIGVQRWEPRERLGEDDR